MTIPPFFVYIIESPREDEIYQGISEGDLLRKAIQLNQIPCEYRLVISKERFISSLFHDLPQVFNQYYSSDHRYYLIVPIIHISCHGDQHGIALTNGDLINWNDLKNLLNPLNQAFNKSLIVCMSCCEGFAGIQMAMNFDNQPPFWAIVANSGKPTWSDTAVAYATFYHHLAKGSFINEAVDAMNIASKNSEFAFETAQQAQQSYIDYINQLNAQQVYQQLNNVRFPNLI